MASGILGQSAPAANTFTTVYTVPASTTSTFTVSFANCNSFSINVRLAVAASATPLTAEYLEFEAIIPANSVLERSGIVAQAGKQVVVHTNVTNTAVSVYGFEE